MPRFGDDRMSGLPDRMGNSPAVVPRRRSSRRKRRRASDGQRALLGVKKLSKWLIQPKQYVDTTLSGTFATSWTFANMTAIAEGDDIGTRSGREIVATHITIRGGLAIGAGSTGNGNRLRLIVFCDHENRGALPGGTDVFVGDTVDSLRNLATQNMRRFTILYDKYITCDKVTAATASNRAFNFDKKINIRVQFTGNLTTDEGKNQLYFGYCTDNVGGFAPIFTAFSRVWYVE